MLHGILAGDKVIVENKEAEEFFKKGWYGEWKEDKLELHLIEAILLAERERIKIKSGERILSLREIFDIASALDEKFIVKYLVYKDLRTRGLPVRIGTNGVDFFVYERGAKPGKRKKIAWITFAYSENDFCDLDELERTVKLGKNIRAKIVWAIVDGDNDVTYYMVDGKKEL